MARVACKEQHAAGPIERIFAMRQRWRCTWNYRASWRRVVQYYTYPGNHSAVDTREGCIFACHFFFHHPAKKHNSVCKRNSQHVRMCRTCISLAHWLATHYVDTLRSPETTVSTARQHKQHRMQAEIWMVTRYHSILRPEMSSTTSQSGDSPRHLFTPWQPLNRFLGSFPDATPPIRSQF